MFANKDPEGPEGLILATIAAGIGSANGSSLSSFASRAIDWRLDDRVGATESSKMVGPDLRFDVRFGKGAGVLTLFAIADFRFDDLVDD